MAGLEDFLLAYHYYRAGFLPESGGIEDQPVTFLEAARVMDAEIASNLADG